MWKKTMKLYENSIKLYEKFKRDAKLVMMGCIINDD